MLNLDAALQARSMLVTAPSLKTSSEPPHIIPLPFSPIIGLNMSAHAEKRIAERITRSRGRVLLVMDEQPPDLVRMLRSNGN
jgi:hypothetical protein